MPTIFTHAVVPLAAGLALGRKTLPPRLVAAGMLAAIAPDFDTVAFRLGIACNSCARVTGFFATSGALVSPPPAPVRTPANPATSSGCSRRSHAA